MSMRRLTRHEAAALVTSGDTIATSGFVGIGTPDALLLDIAERFESEGEPRDLTLLFAAGQGDGKDHGLNRITAPGLLRRVVGGHLGLVPAIARRAVEGYVEAWTLPQGVITHLYRDIAAGKPGTLSRIGLHTFVDPRYEGGRVNDRSTEDLVELVELGGQELLFYKAMPIHVALLRGTTSDEHGNITMEREALTLDALAMAMAARNSGGKVVVQVERIAQGGSLNPRLVKIPHVLVDAVVVADHDLHLQTYGTPYSAGFSHRYKVPLDMLPAIALTPRKVVARRAAMELPLDGVVNLGIGMPEGVASIAAEERVLDRITLTAEPGIVGGVPASGLNFGAAVNPDAVIDQNQQFDFYDGGGLDLAVLGMAQLDGYGNVNVSRFGSRLVGPGGFINISQSARTVVFVGTFTAGGFEADVADGMLTIRREGAHDKIVEQVEQVTFNGRRAADEGRTIWYVTERAVFQATAEGLALVEVAPGVDLEKDILAHMAIQPVLEREPTLMRAGLFADAPVGLLGLLHR